MPALTFTDSADAVTDLNDETNFKLIGIRDAGIPPVRHDTVRTPARDGETYIRTRLEPRFLMVELAVLGTSYADLLTQRRTLISALNPKKGQGTLKWTPAATLYAIDCLVEHGVGFRNYRGPRRENAIISLRCPDPTWFNPTQNSDTIDNTGSGLSVPISVPISFADGTGTTVFTNAGDVDTYPTITVPGACTDPVITNTTTGQKLQFIGLTIAGGTTLTIDCKARTAAVGATSVIEKPSADSEFWVLEPGNNTVTFSVSSGDVDATLKHYTRFLGV